MKPRIPSLFKRFFIPSYFALLILFLAVILPPLLGLPNIYIRILTELFLWIGLAESWNTITGYTGRVDFGHVVFLGVGAYVASIMMMQAGFHWSLGLLIGGMLAAILAFLIGIPTLPLHGAYFAIATWAFAEAMKQLTVVLKITGGSYGLTIPPVVDLRDCYYLMFIAALATTVTNYAIEKSKIGLALRSIGGSEIAAETLGVNTSKYRVIAYIISAFFPGIMGGIYALWINYVYPFDVFEGLKTDQMVIMTLLGGSGSYLGPLIGATLLIVALEIFWTYWTDVLYMVFLGILIVLTVIFMPEGILGILRKRRIKKKPLKKRFLGFFRLSASS